jgi:hypothetical protein
MSLVLKSPGISVAFGTASFFLADDDKTVRVDVDQDLLARIESPAPKTRDAYKERLVRHRRQFSKIAVLKYRAGFYKSEVRVLVVSITANDMF